jgi:FkbM family methyltransferase
MLFRLSLERARAGLAVWDVGANVGMFALASAARGAQVLAIEPDAFLYRLLMETRDHPRNREFHLEVLCAAVADNPGVANLAIASRGRASSYLEAFSGRSQAGGIRTKCLVPVLTLDLLLDGREPPALVKVDVEGAELAVLKGAKRLLENVRPTILIEVGDSTRTGVIATLRDAGYVVQDYEEMGAASGAQSASGTNLLALPNNRTQ